MSAAIASAARCPDGEHVAPLLGAQRMSEPPAPLHDDDRAGEPADVGCAAGSEAAARAGTSSLMIKPYGSIAPRAPNVPEDT
jgi:hypothetical protein